MTLFAIAVAAGCLGGYARSGRLRRLGDLRLSAPALVGLALAFQVGAGLAPEGWRGAAIGASYVLAGAFLAANLRGRSPVVRAGIALLALGWGLNVMVMAPHRAMPVSAEALRRTGGARVDVRTGHLSKHVNAAGPSAVGLLGDVIPVRPLRAVLSLGDLALLAGVALVVGGGMGGGLAVPPTGDAEPAREAPVAPEAPRGLGMAAPQDRAAGAADVTSLGDAIGRALEPVGPPADLWRQA
ncbi:MAG: DUF5317 family protein [Acidimicrobiales bacterium]